MEAKKIYKNKKSTQKPLLFEVYFKLAAYAWFVMAETRNLSFDLVEILKGRKREA